MGQKLGPEVFEIVDPGDGEAPTTALTTGTVARESLALNSKNALPEEGGVWAPPAGLEPAAKRLEGACSIH